MAEKAEKAEKAPTKRRSQAQVKEDVEKVNKLVAGGMSPTAACEQEGLNYQTYTRHASPQATGNVGDVEKAVKEFKAAAERLRALGVTFTVSKLKYKVEQVFEV